MLKLMLNWSWLLRFLTLITRISKVVQLIMNSILLGSLLLICVLVLLLVF